MAKNATPLRIIPLGGLDGIGKGTYTLTITVETVQADKCAQAWEGAPTSICPTN